MKQMGLFATYLYSVDMKPDMNLEKIARTLEESKSSSRTISNSGGWQSGNQNFNSNEEMKPLLRDVLSIMGGIYRDYGLKFKPSIIEYWFNINRKFNFNWSHNHPGFFFSAVLYVKSPLDSGNIIFERPDNASDWIPVEVFNEKSASALIVTPKVNNLLIFPSYLKHKVEQNLSDEDRISIAFNVK